MNQTQNKLFNFIFIFFASKEAFERDLADFIEIHYFQWECNESFINYHQLTVL